MFVVAIFDEEETLSLGSCEYWVVRVDSDVL